MQAREGVCFSELKENIDANQMMTDLLEAQEGAIQFDADKYVNRFPAKKHDHFLDSRRNSALLGQEQHGA